MYRIVGKRILEFSEQQLAELAATHERVAIEVGTGNGAFLRWLVVTEPTTLGIGLDPSVDVLERPSRLAAKQGDNPVFLRAAIEAAPAELGGMADVLYVYFPWGSLLRGLVMPDDAVIDNVAGLMKEGGSFRFLLTYDPVRDATLALPELNGRYFEERLVSAYREHELILEEWRAATGEEIAASRSSWAKRLRSNKQREVWSIRGLRARGN